MFVRSLILAVVCLQFSGVAMAGLVANVQFGSGFTGPAVAGGVSDYWNSLITGSGTGLSLQDVTGAGTGMSISWTSGRVDVWSGFNGFAGGPYQALMESYIFSANPSPEHIVISGLTPGSTFDLYIYSQGDSGADGRRMQVDVNGTVANTDPADYSASTFILGQNYLKLAVTADGLGNLDIAYSNLAGEANVNGLQLDATVPEPGSLGLLATGLAGLAWLRRRATAR